MWVRHLASPWSLLPCPLQVGGACRAMAAALAAANAAAAAGRYSGPHPSITSGAALNENFRGWRTDV